MEIVRLLPLRGLSRAWGLINEWEGPSWLMQWVITRYAAAFNCNLDEVAEPLSSFKNLQQFFTRRLKDGVRPIAAAPASHHLVVSPVDGRVMTAAAIDDAEGLVEQIKGVRYSVAALLGEAPRVSEVSDTSSTSTVVKNASTQVDANNKNNKKKNKLFHIVLYLAPGDYHGIHSPVDWDVSTRRYVPGMLMVDVVASSRYGY
jgi:phosphatidylserine decarboxylase